MKTNRKTPGQIAYEARNANADARFVSWNNLGETSHTAWKAAAAAVLAEPLAMLKQLLTATTATDFRDLYDARADARELLELMQPPVDEHVDLKKAFDGGATIQINTGTEQSPVWHDTPNPSWQSGCKYRVKPDEWKPWTGGERPVDKETMVKFKLQGNPSEECGPHYAGFLQWGHAWGNFNIVAYKVIEERQPDPLLTRIDAAIAELNKIKEEITK